MPRELPNVGISYAPQVKPNSDRYLNLIAKSNVNTPTSTAVTSLGTNIGDRTYSFNTRRGRSYELGRIESGELQLSVDNSDGLFDPSNTASAFYPNLLPYKPVGVNCAYPLTGNILNDTNLKPPIPATSPATYGDYRVSVGANDGNFELGQTGNWYCSDPNADFFIYSGIGHLGTNTLGFRFIAGSGSVRLDVPVVSGKQITVSMYFQGPANNNLVIRDGGAYGATLSTQPITSVGVFTQFTATVTPQTNKINISVEGTTNGVLNYIDTVQVEFGSSVSAPNANGPTIYSLFNGFIERYPQTYQAPNRGQVNMVATDAIASMSQNTMTNPYESLILQDASPAIYYYPLNEASGSVAAFNAGLFSQPPLTQASFSFPKPVTFGDTSSTDVIIGSGNTCVQLNFHILFPIDGSPPTNGGTNLVNTTVSDLVYQTNTTYTFSFWFNYTGTLPGLPFPDSYWLFQGYTGNNFGGPIPAFRIIVDYLGVSVILLQNDRGTTVIGATTPAAAVANGWNFVSVSLTWTGTQYNVAVTTIGSDNIPNVQTGSGASTTPISFKTFLLQGMETNYNYKVSNFTIHRGFIDAQSYAEVGLLALYGDSTGNRFKNVINTYSGMKYLPYQTDFGKSFMQSALLEGTSLADYVQTVADNENGTWYVDGAGYATFKDRWNRIQKLVPKAVFGDLATITTTGTGALDQNKIVVTSATNIAAGQQVTGAGIVFGSYVTNVSGTTITISNNLFAALSGSNNVSFNESPYAGGDLLINFDQTYVLNDISIKQNNGASILVQDQDSIADYYPRSYGKSITTLADSDASDAANFLLSRYKDPHARPETLTITPARNPSLWAVALGLEIGDLIRVNKRPLGAPALSIDCFVEQIEHSFDAQSGDWITNIKLSPTIDYYWNTAAVRGVTTGSAVTDRVVMAKSPTTAGGFASGRDITPGQMLQHRPFTTTRVVVVVSVVDNSTSVTINTLTIGTFTNRLVEIQTGKVLDPILMDFVSLTATIISVSRLVFTNDWVIVATNDYKAGQYVTLSGLSVGNGSYVVKSAGPSDFIVTAGGAGALVGTGTAINWLAIDNTPLTPRTFNALPTGAAKVLINEEIISVDVVSRNVYPAVTPTVGMEITARAQNNTIQTVSGSGFGTATDTYSHFGGTTIWRLNGLPTAGVAAGTLVTEFLPNQLTQVPYSVPIYQNYDLASTLGSWTGSLQSGTVAVTTPASGIKYATFDMAALSDQDNFPASNIATGQILTMYNNTNVENLAVIGTGVPDDINGSWDLTGYKIVGLTGAYLITNVSVDQTTINCSVAVTASAIFIDGEFMQVTGGSGGFVLTVVRGTPDAAVWGVQTSSRHYVFDQIYAVVNAGFTNTYAQGNSVIEGYNVTTPVIGTARLGY
jgi:hypothetical protein